MPAAPHDVREAEGRFSHQLGYYSSLLSLLTYSFAWTRPDKGLMWWFAHGRPTEDPRLALIAHTWDQDGTLLGFLSWLTTMPPADVTASTLHGFADRVDLSPSPQAPEWATLLREARSRDPWNGGRDPLHLGRGDHISAPSHFDGMLGDEPTDVVPATMRLLGADKAARTATFVSDTVEGWYAGLHAAGDRLPSLDNRRSWRVDVFVKPIGHLGTYRRSRQTGLWFAGEHRYHSIGN